jgi:hypothetical protein
MMDMNDISDILGKLSPEDMDSIMQKAQSIFGTGQKEPKKEEDNSPDMDSFLNPEMILKLSQMMSALNKRDKKADLIIALKPLLSSDKQKKADEAIQMLKLLSILPMLQQQFGLSGDTEQRSGG